MLYVFAEKLSTIYYDTAKQKNPRLRTTGDFWKTMPQTRELVGLADNGFHNHAGAQAAGAHGNRADFAVGELVTHVLKVGVEHTLGLDVGMAHIVAGLGLFATKFALLGHDILHIFGRSPEKIFLGARTVRTKDWFHIRSPKKTQEVSRVFRTERLAVFLPSRVRKGKRSGGISGKGALLPLASGNNGV